MKKKLWAGVLCGILLVVSGCGAGAGVGSNANSLSDKFDEAQVIEEAKVVIDYVNKNDFQTLEEEMWGIVMKENAPASQLEKSVTPILDQLGAFQSFEKEVVTGQKDKDTEQEFAVAVVLAKYEKRKAQYTISFDQDMKVVGFFIK